MHEIRVSHDFDAPARSVFSGVSDHVAFLSNSQIHCRLAREGDNERNGCGAIREVRSGMLRFEEAVTVFDEPKAYEYRILALRGPFGMKLPFQHEHGRIELDSLNGKTRVVWTSRFHFTIPLIGSWLDKKIGSSISATFLFFLKRLDKQLHSNG
jgi:hypothetical protein